MYCNSENEVMQQHKLINRIKSPGKQKIVNISDSCYLEHSSESEQCAGELERELRKERDNLLTC